MEWLNNLVNNIKATELYILNWWVLLYVKFISIRKAGKIIEPGI
jgi:hypothetical protein